MANEKKELIYDVLLQTGWILLNREWRRNALSLEMMDLFFEYLDLAEADESVRVVCISGVGETAFCSGADLMTGFEAEDLIAGPQKYADLLKRLAHFPKPIVGRINGHCVAGGLGLMLSCDIVYARSNIKIGTPEVNVGLFPMMIGALIFRNCPRKKAMEMIYTAEMMGPEQAEQMGLVTRVFPDLKTLNDEVDKLLAVIAKKGPRGMSIGRQAFARADDMDLDSALDHLCRELGEVIKTEDAKEGLTAFIEKRKPVWKNR